MEGGGGEGGGGEGGGGGLVRLAAPKVGELEVDEPEIRQLKLNSSAHR